MQIEVLKSKIHRVTITEANLAATYDMDLALTVTSAGRYSAFKRA